MKLSIHRPLRAAALFGMALLLCQCASVSVDRAWSGYDPLQAPSPEWSERLAAEANRLVSGLRGHPDDGGRLARLADIRFLQGNPSEAVDLYQRSLAADSSSSTVERRARLATALLHLERNDEAREILEAVLHEEPENGRALLSYAEYQANVADDPAQALVLLKRAKDTGSVFIPPDFEQALEQNLN